MSDAIAGPPGVLLRGVAMGLAAAVGWGLYNVGVEIGHRDGLRPADMAAIRFGAGALILLPLVIRAGGLGVGFGRALLLACVAGPPFALLMNAGYARAPLAHAVVIGPGMSMIVTNALVRFAEGKALPPHRIAGIALILVGLIAVGAEAAPTKAPGTSVLVGDLCLVAAGSLWGVFTWLVGLWAMRPVAATATVAMVSSAAFLPVYAVVWGLPDVAPEKIAIQLLYQGAIGGSGAILAYSAAVAALGAGRAAVFGALVPPLAALMAIPMTGILPTAPQWAGIALASAGLLLSLDMLGRRLRATPPH